MDGFTKMIHADGSNGIADITWVAGSLVRMLDKSSDGKLLLVILHR
jgi:hypothetical protein